MSPNSCDRETTFCLVTGPEPALPDTTVSLAVPLPKYTCLCRAGFYVPNETLQGFASEKLDSDVANFSCLPCPGGCLTCDKDGSCSYDREEEDDFLTESVLRASIGAILGCSIFCCVLLSITVFRRRKSKVSCGLWTCAPLIELLRDGSFSMVCLLSVEKVF
jgi:hypothetical protein